MERSLLASGPLRLQSLGNRGEGCSPADSAGILGGDQSQVQGRRGLGWGGGGAERDLWARGTRGCFRPGFGFRRSGLHPRGRKAAKRLPERRASRRPVGLCRLRAGLRALPGSATAAAAAPGRWRSSWETDRLRGAQLRGSLAARAAGKGLAPGQACPGTACLRRRSARRKEKEKPIIFSQ